MSFGVGNTIFGGYTNFGVGNTIDGATSIFFGGYTIFGVECDASMFSDMYTFVGVDGAASVFFDELAELGVRCVSDFINCFFNFFCGTDFGVAPTFVDTGGRVAFLCRFVAPDTFCR